MSVIFAMTLTIDTTIDKVVRPLGGKSNFQTSFI